jgi:hypothetical protein
MSYMISLFQLYLADNKFETLTALLHTRQFMLATDSDGRWVTPLSGVGKISAFEPLFQ